MKTVTYEEFLEFDSHCTDGEEQIKASFDRFGGRMSALDILNLDGVSAEDKLYAVLREEFVPAPILHEFACVCAECALSLLDNPDPRCIKAIKVKRAWIRGKATDKALAAARNAVWPAVCDAAPLSAASYAAVASSDAAGETAENAAWYAARGASEAAREAASDASIAASDATWEALAAYLIMTLEEVK